MAGENDSVITFGLELAEETEKSAGEIASEVGRSSGSPEAANAPEVTNTVEAANAPQAASDARIERARENARIANERQQVEKSQELEQDGLEK